MTPALGRLRQEDCCKFEKFEASLGHIGKSRAAVQVQEENPRAILGMQLQKTFSSRLGKAVASAEHGNILSDPLEVMGKQGDIHRAERQDHTHG